MGRVYVMPACGKLSSGVAVLMKELGHDVYAYDPHPAYPMQANFDASGLSIHTDLPEWDELMPDDTVVMGNSLGRGHPWVEQALEARRRVWSMPEWLCQHVLNGRYVIAVAGTHGKTSVTAMIVFLLRRLGCDPGYLIGGMAQGLPVSAHLGSSPYFVIEADEYDTAWFDKRAKFFWYWPNLVVLNHVEYDHPDIYPNVDAMYHAYRLWLRMLPSSGHLCLSERVAALGLDHPLGGKKHSMDAGLVVRRQDVHHWVYESPQGSYTFRGALVGHYQAENVWCAAFAVSCLGYDLKTSLKHLETFEGVARRMTAMNSIQGVDYYDDFAHHPTAIKAAAQTFIPDRLHIILYPANAFWRSDAALDTMGWSVARSWWVIDHPRLPEHVRHAMKQKVSALGSLEEITEAVLPRLSPGDVVMTCSCDDMTYVHEYIAQRLRSHKDAL